MRGSDKQLGHATSVASLPRARPLPVLREFTRTGFDWVSFRIPDDLFPLPRFRIQRSKSPSPGRIQTLHDPARLERDLPRYGVSRFQEHIDLIWLEHPRARIRLSGSARF